MSKRDITILTNVSLITCVVQKGLADKMVQAARDAGAQGATINFAKGTGIRERLGLLGVAVSVDKEVINIIVGAEQADMVFDALYLAGQLDTPGMGIMYITHMEKAATYIPQEVVAKLQAAASEE